MSSALRLLFLLLELLQFTKAEPPSAGIITCSFDRDFCGWSDTGTLRWALVGGTNILPQHNGSFVSTTNGALGHYTLSSAPISSFLPRNTSLAFWYALRKGYDSVFLNITDPTEQRSSRAIWERRPPQSGVHDITWAYVEIPVIVDYDFRLQFTANIKKEGGLVALDDFVYFGEQDGGPGKPGRRHPALSCTFETGFCDWSNHRSATSQFRLVNVDSALEEVAFNSHRYLLAKNQSIAHLTMASLISPCINVRNSTKILINYHVALSTYQTELRIVIRKNTGTSISPFYNNADNLRAADNIRVILQVVLRPGTSVRLNSIYVANEAESIFYSEGCTPLSDEPLLSEFPTSPTVSCSFDRNFCGWQLSEDDPEGQVVIGRHVFDDVDKKFIPVPVAGVGALIIQAKLIVFNDERPWKAGPFFSPEIVQRKPTEFFFYYRVDHHVNRAWLRAEYADGSGVMLWSFKMRTQEPMISQNYKWLPARIGLCLPGRFRLAFYVQFTMNPRLSLWLDELVLKQESDAITTLTDTFDPVGCIPTAVQPSTAITCDSYTAQTARTNFCGWQCQPNQKVRCSTAETSSAGDYHPLLALVIEANALDLTNGTSATVISTPLTVRPASQLHISYTVIGAPIRVTVAISNSTAQDLSVVVIRVFNFTNDIREWFGLTVTFPSAFYDRTVQAHLLVEFLPRKTPAPYLTAAFAINSIWYTAEEGHTMPVQTDTIPVPESCNSSNYKNISCDFQNTACAWSVNSSPHRTERGKRSWVIGPEYAVLSASSAAADKSTSEMHTSYHGPIAEIMRFSYRTQGTGRVFLELLAQIQNDVFRLWTYSSMDRQTPASSFPLPTHAEKQEVSAWKTVEIPLCMKFPFRLVFRASAVTKNISILLDDVTMDNECDFLTYNIDCPAMKLIGPPTSKIPQETELRSSWSGEHSCAFENGDLCGWRNNDNNQVQWSAVAFGTAETGRNVAELAWNDPQMRLPAFSYLISPKLIATVDMLSDTTPRKLLLQFSIRIVNTETAYVELYFARTGTLHPNSILWNSDNLPRTDDSQWISVGVELPPLDAANINQLVFAVAMLHDRGTVFLDDILLRVAQDSTDPLLWYQVALVLLGVFVASIVAGALSIFVRRHMKIPDVNRQLLAGFVPWEIIQRFEQPHWSVQLELRHVGEGRFGYVQLGWIPTAYHPSNQPVAIKRLNRQHSTVGRDRFLVEMAVFMKVGKHRNVVELLAITTQKELMIVMEYCEGGSLLGHLHDPSNFPACNAHMKNNPYDGSAVQKEIVRLVLFSYDVARGMEFLSNGHIVHGDLAARNILLDSLKRAKIADFGMAKFEGDFDTKALLENSLLPAGWVAPEVLAPTVNPCQSQSDVWSFGVLVWEIFSLGAKPYEAMFAAMDFTCAALWGYLNAGCRLPVPTLLPEKLQEMVKMCWEFKPEQRPSFRELLRITGGLLPSQAKEVYISCEKDERNNDAVSDQSAG
ncbi:uncharacterized protein LOC129590002 [Paramacrobiotus metropolitanus]|uniref:uncharacterized protein LOC129590002 n=1 Tax=Paramacrobiotus metropolitanus TaxID=2943436 RepID=UPI0024461E1A|nr:uncharacterized protein LOC129590002 [Paramacrobiotus metropolitanus]